MKKSVAIMLLAVVAFFMSSLAAEAGVINIKNATGFDIYEIYVSDSGADSWEEDVLGRDILGNGQTLRLNVNGSYRKFDMRAVSKEGDACDWYGLPGNVKSISIAGDGTATYK